MLQDLGVENQTDAQAWDALATYEAATLHAGRSVLEAMRDVVHAYRSGEYPSQQREASRIWALDDELLGGWGRASNEVEMEVAGILSSWAARVTPD